MYSSMYLFSGNTQGADDGYSKHEQNFKSIKKPVSLEQLQCESYLPSSHRILRCDPTNLYQKTSKPIPSTSGQRESVQA